MLQFFLEGETKYGNKHRDIVWRIDLRKGHPETAPHGDLFRIQSPNPDTIMDADRNLI